MTEEQFRECYMFCEIHVLIGEAPPYYPNCEFPQHRNRKYFCDENQSMNTAYFIQPPVNCNVNRV